MEAAQRGRTIGWVRQLMLAGALALALGIGAAGPQVPVAENPGPIGAMKAVAIIL